MKKLKENRTGPAKGAKVLSFMRKQAFSLLLSALFMVSMLSSCEKNGEASESREDSTGIPQEIPDAAPQENHAVILIRGNYWTPGIPGFGANSFSALTGEYRFEDLSSQTDETGESNEGRDFSVYLTMEPLYFSEEWKQRPRTGDITVFQRTGEEGFITATVLEDSREASDFPKGVSWTAVFLFPRGLEEAGFSEDVYTQMLRIWMGRFSYFLSLSNTTREISLPAVVDF